MVDRVLGAAASPEKAWKPPPYLGFSTRNVISSLTEFFHEVVGMEARLAWVEERGEGITNMEKPSVKPGFRWDERVGGEGSSGEVCIFYLKQFFY